MTDPTITESQARERERGAFLDGAIWYSDQLKVDDDGFLRYSPGGNRITFEAHRRYPAPRSPRTPREVNDPHRAELSWRVACGQLQFREGAALWRSLLYSDHAPTWERIDLWSDLRAFPYQDAEGRKYRTLEGDE